MAVDCVISISWSGDKDSLLELAVSEGLRADECGCVYRVRNVRTRNGSIRTKVSKFPGFFVQNIFDFYLRARNQVTPSHCIFLKEKLKDGFSYLIFVVILD